MAKKITWWQAAEILGIGDRTMRRWKWKYENEGFKGLLDGRKDKIDGSGLKAMLRQRRDNETGIAALFLIFSFRNHAPCAAPTFSRPIVKTRAGLRLFSNSCRASCSSISIIAISRSFLEKPIT